MPINILVMLKTRCMNLVVLKLERLGLLSNTRVGLYMMVNGLGVQEMGLVFKFGKMGLVLKGNGKTIWLMGRGNSFM